MTEISGFYTTEASTPAGHQVASYTQAIAAKAWAVLAACAGYQGIAPGLLNKLVGSVPGVNTCRIGTGGAVVDGQWYLNDAAVDVTIPSAVGAGNTRIDRVVLRITWANFEAVITRIAGTDAASPSAPAITQTTGTVYDIMLYQALVNTGGAVTLTDERVYATPTVDNSTIELSAGALRVKDDGITAAKIAANAVGASEISSGAVGSDELAAGAVIAGKIANGGVDTTARLANDIVDDTKVGNRVPQFYRREGGSATEWATAGTTTYTPAAVRMQGGAAVWSGGPAASGTVNVTFPTAFSYKPIAFAICGFGYLGGSVNISVSVPTISASGITIYWESPDDQTSLVIYWLAIGPE